jgi:hypothetical protein
MRSSSLDSLAAVFSPKFNPESGLYPMYCDDGRPEWSSNATPASTKEPGRNMRRDPAEGQLNITLL